MSIDSAHRTSAFASYRPKAAIPLPATIGQSALRPWSPLSEVVRLLKSGRMIEGRVGRLWWNPAVRRRRDPKLSVGDAFELRSPRNLSRATGTALAALLC
jgi:hypothetical protein